MKEATDARNSGVCTQGFWPQSHALHLHHGYTVVHDRFLGVKTVLSIPQTVSPVLDTRSARSGAYFMRQDTLTTVPTFLKPFLLPKMSVSFRKERGKKAEWIKLGLFEGFEHFTLRVEKHCLASWEWRCWNGRVHWYLHQGKPHCNAFVTMVTDQRIYFNTAQW